MKRVHATRACDPCIRRKIRCISENAGEICKNCERLKKTCTWTKERRPRGPSRRSDVNHDGSQSNSSPEAARHELERANGHHVPAGAPMPGDVTREPLGAAAGIGLQPQPSLSSTTTTPFDRISASAMSLPPPAVEPLQPGLGDPPIDLLNVDSMWPELASGQAVTSYMEASDWMFVQALGPNFRYSNGFGLSDDAMLAGQAPQTVSSVDSTAFPVDDVALLGYIESYFGANHCILPIVERHDVLSRLAKNEHYTDQRFMALVYSMVVVSEMIEDVAWPPNRRVRANVVRDYIAIAQQNFIHPAASGDFRIEDIATCLNLNFVWVGMADKPSAWFWLQQALSIAQALMIDDWDPDLTHPESLQRLKSYYVLVIIERATALFQSTLVLGSQQGLRLTGDVWDMTAEWRAALPPDALDDFPLLHMKLFSIITPEIVACWRGRCANKRRLCTRWSAESAVRVQQTFGREVASAMALPKTAEYVKLTITAVWIQDRLWNLHRTHGLVKHDHHYPELSLDLVIVNLIRCSDYCATVANKENFTAFDLCIKIADLVMTAITIMGSKEPWIQGSDREMLSITFRPLIDRFIGLLMSIKHEDLAMELVRSLQAVQAEM